ncbi:hypothetical protein BABINDRAFT_158881 [Babjeviella inositovora NRRL Y-12698]|uniref:Mid2 domain-containing protein n=1 Tax=Babjeviella inositovora NRRL Y-12698 TaxID=984486 RepID=A0A1E3QX58_9ASCO|nr:uncharacterized protein BABINDRAFT_158881 [Babjeviella inositovora NRRL Y-12698]ODQ82246.1 hypothetical protein BABINDRAFT_158881 [Babjeviella inositovora NRRL Y-12698]
MNPASLQRYLLTALMALFTTKSVTAITTTSTVSTSSSHSSSNSKVASTTSSLSTTATSSTTSTTSTISSTTSTISSTASAKSSTITSTTTLATSSQLVATNVKNLPKLAEVLSSSYTSVVQSIPTLHNPYIYNDSGHQNGYTFIVAGSLVGALIAFYMLAHVWLYFRSRKRIQNEENGDFWNDDVYGKYDPELFGTASYDTSTEKGATYSDVTPRGGSIDRLRGRYDDSALSLTLNGSSSDLLTDLYQGRSYRNALNHKPSRSSMFISPLDQYMNFAAMSNNCNLDSGSSSLIGLSFASQAPSLSNYSSRPLLGSQVLLPSETKRIRPPSQCLDDLLSTK